MKTLLKIIAGIGLFGAGIFALIMFLTAGLTETADEFFSAVKSDNFEKAYALLSKDFQNNTSKKQLQEYLTKSALNTFESASWNSRSITGSRGELVGSITTENKNVVPISLGLVKGEDGWKIYSIKKPPSVLSVSLIFKEREDGWKINSTKKPPSGIQEEIQTAQLPSEEEQVQLVNESMYAFALSVKEQNMSKLYAHLSNFAKKQSSIEYLNQTFSPFYPNGDAFMVTEQLTPQFSKKVIINADGIIILEGGYPTKANNITFTQKYLYEGLSWRLIGFTVSIST